MQIWVCKMCGRSMLVKKKPSYCYFEKTSSLEQISKEEADKICLFRGNVLELVEFLQEEKDILNFIPEFKEGVRFDPFTGAGMCDSLSTLTKLRKV
jgi:hypothetical protein